MLLAFVAMSLASKTLLKLLEQIPIRLKQKQGKVIR
jgi:hypothetical protein